VNLAESVKAQISAIASGNPDNRGRIDLKSEPVWVNGDPVRLEQIVGNLISNALKFTRGEGMISVSVGKEGDDAVLRVADQGIGIPADMLPKISTCSCRRIRPSIDRAADWALASRWYGGWPSCTAAACTRPVRATVAARRSQCGCRPWPRRRSRALLDAIPMVTRTGALRVAPRAARG
jgi:hypothetical protein